MSDPQGLAFAALAEDYDLGRPPWPGSILEGIGGESALDLAAGTGKLTSLLIERFTDVTAVEPLAGMRAVLERNVPGAHTVAGSAERIPLDDASVDAAFVAEAFHWFDSRAAVRELERVLRPGGVLIVCFNVWHGFDPPLPEAFNAVRAAVTAELPAPGGPKLQTGEWKTGFDRASFAPFEESEHRHVWETSAESIAAYFVSTSSMGSLDSARRQALRAELVSLLPVATYRLDIGARVFRTVRT